MNLKEEKIAYTICFMSVRNVYFMDIIYHLEFAIKDKNNSSLKSNCITSICYYILTSYLRHFIF